MGSEKKRHILTFAVIFSVFLLLIAIIVTLAAKNKKLSEQLSADEDYISAAASRVYEYYGSKDYIEISDYSNDKIILKALENVPKTELKPENLSSDGDFRYYTENGEVTSKLGVDVSYFQGDIDWQIVKEAGIEFAMIRAGYRGYESGKINKDPRFDEYMSGAAEAGIETGIYFYSQAVTVEEAEAEAEFVLSQTEGYDITYPVVFDWELTGEESARTNGLSPALLTDITAKFCSTVAGAGYIPMIYSSKRQALLRTDMDCLYMFDFWLCEYAESPEYPYIYQMWQYSSDAEVPGIKGKVDINISFIDYTKERMGVMSGEFT